MKVQVKKVKGWARVILVVALVLGFLGAVVFLAFWDLPTSSPPVDRVPFKVFQVSAQGSAEPRCFLVRTWARGSHGYSQMVQVPCSWKGRPLTVQE